MITLNELTDGILVYNSVKTQIIYDGNNYIRIIADINGKNTSKPEQIVYDYNVMLGSAHIDVKSVRKTFDIFSGDALENTHNKLRKYLVSSTSYASKGRKPIDVYGVLNRLMVLTKQKKKFMINVYDLQVDRVPEGYTPLLTITGAYTDNPPFMFEIAVNGGKPYIKLHNSKLGTQYNADNYLEIQVNELVPLLLNHYK